MFSHGLYEPVKNSQDIRGKKAVRYQSNLSLQDEEKLSRLPGQAVSKISQVRTSSACSSFKLHEEDLSLINASQKRNFKFQATGDITE